MTRTALFLLASVPALRGQTRTAPMNASEQKNLAMVLTWWREVIEARHTELADKYQAEDYIQHDPNVLTGRAPMIAYFEHVGKPINPIPEKLTLPPVVQGAKGDFVWLIFEDTATRTYTFEILRIQNGKVQEHWDADQRIPGSPAFVPYPGPPPSTWNTGTVSPAERRNLGVAMKGESSKSKRPPVLTLVNGPYVLLMWEHKNKEATWNSFAAVRVENGRVEQKWN